MYLRGSDLKYLLDYFSDVRWDVAIFSILKIASFISLISATASEEYALEIVLSGISVPPPTASDAPPLDDVPRTRASLFSIIKLRTYSGFLGAINDASARPGVYIQRNGYTKV